MKRSIKKALLITCMTGMVLIGCGEIDNMAFEESTTMLSGIKQTRFYETLELGKDFELNAEDYFDITGDVRIEDIIIDSQAIDMHSIGQYIATATYDGNRYDIAVSVADTIAPQISVKNEAKSVDLGSIIEPRDYVKADDADETALFFVTEEGDKKEIAVSLDLDIIIKEVCYNVVAVDLSGNRSEEIQITIPIAHNFSSEVINEEKDNQVYESDQFICETCESRYIESALDDIAGEDLFDTELTDYQIEDIEKKMVVNQACNVRTGPCIECKKTGSLKANDVVEITGYCEAENWYRIIKDNSEVFVLGDYLSEISNKKTEKKNDICYDEPEITQAQHEAALASITGGMTNLDELPTIDWNDYVEGQPFCIWDEEANDWIGNPFYNDIGKNWH